MLQLIYFLLICFGMTNIVTGSNLRVFKFLRKKSNLFKCSMCFGFWIGVVLGVFNFITPANLLSIQIYYPCYPFVKWFINGFTCGVISSGWCWIIRVLLHALKEDQI